MGSNVDYRLRQMLVDDEHRLAAIAKQTENLAHGGGPPYDSDMEARVAVLEQIARNTEKVLDRMDARLVRIEDGQKTDFRVLFGALIATALGLAGLMAKGFHWF